MTNWKITTNNRNAQVDWLKELASNMLTLGEGSPEEIVEYGLSDEGRESWGIELPDWFDQHDCDLLIRFMEYLADE